MKRALGELTSATEALGLTRLRVVHVSAWDLKSNFECMHLDREGFYWRPCGTDRNFRTLPSGSRWQQIVAAPFHWLGSNLSESLSALRNDGKTIGKRLDEYDAELEEIGRV